MMEYIFRQIFFAFFLFSLVSTTVWGFEPFTIQDIKVNGLQRISVGTVFNYLPLKVGDFLDDRRSIAAIRVLYETGFFQDVTLKRNKDILIVDIVERPAIESIKISGNKEIETDTLTDALKQVGLAENKVFNRSLLDKVEQELERQYFALGKYGVKIESKVETLKRNRVAISLNIFEGDAAQIKRINIIGNDVFTEKDLVRSFQLTELTIFSFFTDSDKYSKQKLRADLESLRSYYLDRGFINIQILSTQVTITPDKKNIYITINISEGEKFFVGDIKLIGKMVVPRKELEKLITLKKGEPFSRRKITEISSALAEKLGDVGYAFANINPVPDIDNSNKKVSMTFFIDPAKRVYVRRINIGGNDKSQDEVIRREIRQFEGGWFTPEKLSRSRIRLQRLGYFDDINIETPRVPGTGDQVDIDITVSEARTGTLEANLGYGQVNGIQFGAKVAFNNFLGTGKRISLEATRNQVNTIYSFGYTNPYYTDSGISRGFNVFYRETDANQANIADYTADDKGASVKYGFPISEFDTARAGLGLKNINLKGDFGDLPEDPIDPQALVNFQNDIDKENKEDDITIDNVKNSHFNAYLPTKVNTNIPIEFKNWISEYGDSFNTVTLDASWSHDTRNRTFLAEKGFLNQLSGEIALPGGDLEYYKMSYHAEVNWPIYRGFSIQVKSLLSYGDGYGDTDDLPFFERFYAGGPRSVRGFENNRLGPLDQNPNPPANPDDDFVEQPNPLYYSDRPLGGNIKIIGNFELIFPLPFIENSRAFRLATFIDVGNVFKDRDQVKIDNFRATRGLALLWVTPVGVFSFSWGWIFNEQEADKNNKQLFQFYIGAPF